MIAGCGYQRILAGMTNVLILLTDQQRKDSLGCYGHPCARTPHLDALAARGRRFERHYVANPICMPNRLSIATGRHPRNHGMWTNGLPLDPLPQTLAGHLHSVGYETVSFGKIHYSPSSGDGFESRSRWHGRPDDEAQADVGPYAGFERAELTLGHGARPVAHFGAWFRANGGTDAMLQPDADGARPMPKELYPSAFVGDRTCAFLREERDSERPFLCVASFPDPHHPFDAPRECFDAVDPDALPEPNGGPEDLATRPAHYQQQYDGSWHRRGLSEPEHPDGIDPAESLRRRRHTVAMVEEIDRQVGRILDSLDQAGLTDDTIVLFLTDHGEQLGDHGLWYKGPFPFENLINTPLLAAGPGIVPGVDDALVSDVDIAPTLCALLGVDELPGCDGIAQHQRWAGGAPQRDHCLVEYRNGYGDADRAMAVLVKPDIKYMRYQDGVEECTDLAADPLERVNASAHPRLPELRAELLDRLLQTGSRLPLQAGHA